MNVQRIFAGTFKYGFLLVLTFTTLTQCNYLDQVEVVELGEVCEPGCSGWALCEGELYCCYPGGDKTGEKTCVKEIKECLAAPSAGDGLDAHHDGVPGDLAPWACGRRCASGVGCLDSNGCKCCSRGQWCTWDSSGQARCTGREAGLTPDMPRRSDLSGDRKR
jgi:hypothetical protein